MFTCEEKTRLSTGSQKVMLERICNGIKQNKTTFYNMGFEVVNYSGQHLHIDKIEHLQKNV